jgi:hypothetical protein
MDEQDAYIVYKGGRSNMNASAEAAVQNGDVAAKPWYKMNEVDIKVAVDASLEKIRKSRSKNTRTRNSSFFKYLGEATKKQKGELDFLKGVKEE